MSRFTLLPSVNWNVSHMLMINEAGTVCAYGSRGDIVIIRNVHQGDISELKYKFIPRAHKNNRVTGLVFVKQEIEGHVVESLASCGDDGHIKVWDYESGINTHKFNAKKVGHLLVILYIKELRISLKLSSFLTSIFKLYYYCYRHFQK